jgi:hypothetical protein
LIKGGIKKMKNRIMEKLLNKLEKKKFQEEVMIKKLNNILEEKLFNIIEIDNIIIISYNNENIKINKNFIIEKFKTFSSFEDYENHIHIIDLIDCDVIESLQYGIILMNLIINKLKRKFPGIEFVNVLSCDGKNKLNTIYRLHKYRPDEIILYDQNIINNYDKIKCKTGFLINKT